MRCSCRCRLLSLRETKRILRASQKNRLPSAILNRPKQGFGVPVRSWLRGPARDLMEDLVSPATVSARGLFDPDAVVALKSDFQAPRRCRLYLVPDDGSRVMVPSTGQCGDCPRMRIRLTSDPTESIRKIENLSDAALRLAFFAGHGRLAERQNHGVEPNTDLPAKAARIYAGETR